jgi:ferredoxin, 2Fe-2S
MRHLALRLQPVPRVTIEPLGVTLDCHDGESVFACARRNNVFIPTACAGKATCGLCRVKMIAGEANVAPINRDEQKHLGNTYFITKLRLSCQAVVTGGDVTVLIPDAKPKAPSR